MNIFEIVGAFFDGIFGLGPQGNASPQVNNRVDNMLRDENGGIYTNFKEEAEMDPYCDTEGVYYSDDEEYDYSEDENCDFSDEEEYS